MADDCSKAGTVNKIIKRMYYELQCELSSPMSAGSGESEFSDMDIMQNDKNEPFISGTAIAGVFRNFLINEKEADRANDLFGAKLEGEPSEQFHQSRLLVSHAPFLKYNVSVRDHVRLEHKVPVPQAKYDMQVINTGSEFVLRFEVIQREQNCAFDDEETIEKMTSAVQNGEIRIGRKINRGYGKFAITKMRRKVFEYPKDVNEWLDWQWSQLSDNEELELPELSEPNNCIQLEVNIKQTLLVRDEKNQQPDLDFTFLKMDGKAVIPGTTWAGAFRQRLQDILQQVSHTLSIECRAEEITDQLFGSKHGEENASPSILRFEESVVEGGVSKKMSRIAVDRFSGAVVSGALFTGEVLYGGKTHLLISWNNHRNDIDERVIKGMLYWVLRDFQEGLLAAGGETAIGRGVFEISRTDQLEELENGEEVISFLRQEVQNNAPSKKD